MYPYPIRIKVSLWSLLNQHPMLQAVVWAVMALGIGIILAGMIGGLI